MKKMIIVVNWNNETSIKKAERQKTRLENQGYSLIDTESSLNSAVLVYSLQGSRHESK